MKRPFDTIKELFFENLKSSKENVRFDFEQWDKLLVWFVGFSIGGIALIVSNFTPLNKIFCYYTIKMVLTMLVLSISFGIIYRIVAFLKLKQLRNIELFLDVAFSDKEMMDINPTLLKDEDDINIVFKKIKDDFDEDLSYMHNFYVVSSDEHKAILLKSYKDYHKKLSEWAKADSKRAIEYVKDTYQKAFDLSQKTTEEIFSNQNSPKYFRLFHWIASIAFLICCGTFLCALIILCVQY